MPFKPNHKAIPFVSVKSSLSARAPQHQARMAVIGKNISKGMKASQSNALKEPHVPPPNGKGHLANADIKSRTPKMDIADAVAQQRIGAAEKAQTEGGFKAKASVVFPVRPARNTFGKVQAPAGVRQAITPFTKGNTPPSPAKTT